MRACVPLYLHVYVRVPPTETNRDMRVGVGGGGLGDPKRGQAGGQMGWAGTQKGTKRDAR